MSSSAERAYDAVAVFAAELVRNGVTDVVISPGSRSTPLALGMHSQPGLRTWIHVDERSAAYFALGLGRTTGLPAVLVCTSGTAAANYLPGILEAHHAGVPLIACTADRPPELRDWGAGQTVEQTAIYGRAPRWTADLPVAGEVPVDHFRVAAMRAVRVAAGSDPGPVHLNWPLREPLEPHGQPARLEVLAAPPARPRVSAASETPDAIAQILDAERGAVVVGPSPGIGLAAEVARAEAVVAFARSRGWPVLGEPLTHVRRLAGPGSPVVVSGDRLLDERRFADQMAPDVVLRIGRSPTTKSVRLWIERHRPDRVVLVDPTGHWNDPTFRVTDHVALDPGAALPAADTDAVDSPWLERWQNADASTRDAIGRVLAEGGLLSAATARTVVDALPDGSILMVSNSLPVRDVDAFAEPGHRTLVTGNRGASGIDGVTSTALGLAAARADGRATLLTGDLALLHDLSALIAAARLGLHLTVVCVDNGGGGIFSMLPIARSPSVDFETLFRTPPEMDLDQLDGVAGVRARVAATAADLRTMIESSVDRGEPGVDLVIVRIDHETDMAQRRTIRERISEALIDA